MGQRRQAADRGHQRRLGLERNLILFGGWLTEHLVIN
jgi:hypothetical protein